MRAIRKMLFGVLVGVIVLGASGARAQNTMTLDLGGGVNMEFMLISAGSFYMPGGDNPGPLVLVTISHPHYVGKYEVTQAQYQQVMGSNPSGRKDPTRPVENLCYMEATAFCTNLSAKCGMVVRLPTSAEWEYSCRAGSTTAYCFGDSTNLLPLYAWYADNSDGMTHPVGLKLPNAWGLYDVAGNVLEWCEDGCQGYPTNDVTDPYNILIHHREVRSSAFDYTAAQCQSSTRYGGPQGTRQIRG
jgi:formylglycine-generating enzyme required for sulfatase activity